MSDEPDTELTKYLGAAKAEGAAAEKMGEAPDFPGLQYLGCGYDIFGRYAHKSYTKPLLFDFSKEEKIKRQFLDRSLTAEQLSKSFATLPPELKLNYSLFKRVQYKPSFESEVEYQFEGSLAKEQESFSANLGIGVDVGAFSAELEARYKQDKSRLVTQQFYSATAIARYYDLTMDNFDSPELHPDLLPVAAVFKKDLHDSNITPDQLFRNYGTHYLSKITIGCRLVYAHKVDTSKLTSNFDAEASLKAKYEGVSGNLGTTYIASKDNEGHAESFRWYSQGLDPSEDLSGGHGEGEKPPPHLRPLSLLKSGWHNPVLIDFPKDALTPIWYLCTDETRKQELEAGFNNYAKKHGVVVRSIKKNVRALYLLRKEINKVPLYRFSQTLSRKYWADGIPVGQNPWLYVFDSQVDNTVPLYEYYCEGFPDDYRYETGAWDPYLKFFGNKWKKKTDKPIGYVYDGLTDGPKGSAPVYAYFRKDATSGHLSPFYSIDSSDSSDDGGWREMEHPKDDLRDPNINLGNVPTDVGKVLDLENNIHWKTPTLDEG